MFLAAFLEKLSARVGVDVFLFDHLRHLRGDGRGLASACENQLRGFAVFYSLQGGGVLGMKRVESNVIVPPF